MRRKLNCLSFILFMLCGIGFAQSTNNAYQKYIDTYKVIAILQMQKYQIPASITLAQGLLESAAGQSRLATQANNHFGIKVGSDWTGPYMLSDDETKNEKFRKYNNVSESYEDHSLFLHKDRYAALFTLSPTDYKGWANTLKSCGYATSANYADNLISIIERYNLTQYDNATVTSEQATQYFNTANSTITGSDSSSNFYTTHQLGKCNGIYYIIVQNGDNLKSIATAVGKKTKKLRWYNNIPKGCDVYPGQIIYLGKKKKKASAQMKGIAHVVQPGESMYSISQRYGVKVSSVYKINNLGGNYTAKVGDKLYVY